MKAKVPRYDKVRHSRFATTNNVKLVYTNFGANVCVLCDSKNRRSRAISGNDSVCTDECGGGDTWMLQSANAGFGDRADPSKWSEVEGPLKVVLFEGWMLGFEPEDEAAVTAVDPQVSLCLLPLSERILNKVSGCSKL
jgi:hypothetical protein